MRILLLGRNGQVGWEVQRSLAPLGEVFALDYRLEDHPLWEGQPRAGDFSDPEGLRETVRRVRPEAIVNAAAHTAVDRAESEPELARCLNATAVGVLAEEAATLGAALVHYSTDYVFDGSGDRPWTEGDTPAPLNVYGRTKLEGEQLVQRHCPKHLIFRTSWVYAARGGNFAKTMLRLGQERDALSVIDDQHGAPTGAELLADVTAHALRQLLRGDSQCAGLYHLVAGGETTWHGYASLVLQTAREAGVPVRVAQDAIAAVPTSAFPTPARRPLNSRLSTTRLQQTFGLVLPDWQQGVRRMLAEIRPDGKAAK